MKEKLEKVKEALKLADRLFCDDNTAHSIKNGLALIDSILAELDSEPDFYYNLKEWDNTYHFETDVLEYFDFRVDKILHMGRLKNLPPKYVIQNPDEECDDCLYFDTLEEAKAAIEAITV